MLLALSLALLLTVSACSVTGLLAPASEGSATVTDATSASETANDPGQTPATNDAAEDNPPPSRIEAVVTRIVERTVFVTSTPPAERPADEEEALVVLDVSQLGQLPNLDPQVTSRPSQFDLGENLFAGLTSYNPQTNTVEPELASSWSVGPDGRTWTFTLRDDINWVRPGARPNDEDELWPVEVVRPVVAGDIVYAIRRLCSRQAENEVGYALFIIDGCERAFTALEPTEGDLSGIGIRAIDDTTLEIVLTKPASYFLALTSTPLFQPLPQEFVEELGTEWTGFGGSPGTGWQTLQNLATSGPFFIAPPDSSSQRVVLYRNSAWPIDRGGNVDVVNMYFVDEPMDAYELWRERTLDVSPLPASERESFLERTPDKMDLVPEQILFYIGFNFDRGVFSEPEVRRAFSAAIDRERLVEEIYGGRGIVMRHVTVPGVVGTIPTDEVGVAYSPDYARQQMAASSYRSCRLMPPVTLLVSSADLSLRQAELIRDMWVDELSCPQESINIEQAQFGALLSSTRRDAGNDRPDMWELAWSPVFPDAHNLISDLLHCTDSENRQNRECSEADTLIRRAGSAADDAERNNLYRQAERLLFGEGGLMPLAPLYVRALDIAVHDWVQRTPVIYGGEQYDTYVINNELKALERSR